MSVSKWVTCVCDNHAMYWQIWAYIKTMADKATQNHVCYSHTYFTGGFSGLLLLQPPVLCLDNLS